ncbi:MAG: hypothetical protein SPJ23_02775, partial [Eubacteriales bacterium]|nr:hypothetical protein [Eubacteriales bacterium]
MKKKNWYRGLSLADDKYIAEAHPDNVIKPKRNRMFISRVAACLALILCTVVTAKYLSSHATAGAFTLDVNPSVEYTIAKNGTVKD